MPAVPFRFQKPTASGADGTGTRTSGLPKLQENPTEQAGNQFSTMSGYPSVHGDSGPSKLGMTARKRRSDMLEVWLEIFAKIEGPRRRREKELRRRRDNPVRHRSSPLRTFGSFR